jgi:hypothetical protein
MATTYAECRSTKDSTCIRMCVCKVKDGKPVAPKGWELVECSVMPEQYYHSGTVRHQPVFNKR